MDNSWNQQPYSANGSAANGNGNANGHGNNNNGGARSGSLLRDYRQQQGQQGMQQYSPTLMSTQQAGPPPYSPNSPIPQGAVQQSPVQPMSPVLPPQQQGWFPAQNMYAASAAPVGQPQGFIANTMQMVRSWSGRMRAVRQAPAAPEPMVLYRPPTPLPEQPKRTQPWKRSRSVRVAMRMKHRRERWQRSRPPIGKIVGGILIAFCLLLVISLSSGSAYAYSYYQSQLPRLQGLASQQTDQTTRIYDRNGVLLYEAYDNTQGRSTPIAFKYVPKVMQDAMISAEDPTFWTNSGIDPQGIVRAATEYASTGSVQSGGSTITQQVVKNMTHDTDVSLNRKIPEAALAIGMTQQYPKWKILEMYFNIAPFGAQDIGVEAATRDYFHLQPKCNQDFSCIPAMYNLDVNSKGQHDPLLGLARASLLAGMPQNPPAYDPTLGPTNKQNALLRQDYVLNQMMLHGMSVQGLGLITPAIIKQAEALTTKMTFTRYQHTIKAPHFVYWIISQLETALGGGDPQKGVQAFVTGGFNVRTTIDSRLEAYVESAVHRHLDEPEYQPFIGDYGPLNTVHNVNDSAVVVMNAKTGEVLAMDGSTNYWNNSPQIAGNVNAALAPRQPGSSFKPIIYSTAFDMGWYPGLIVPDRLTYFPMNGYQDPAGNLTNSTYHPTDYGGRYNNMNSTIRLDLQNSFNVPAVKAFEYAGMNNVVNMARRFGITAIDDDVATYNQIHHTNDTIAQLFGPSMALGTAGIPLLQMVGAYQVFANQGSRIPPTGILDIWDNYGHHLFHYDTAHPHTIPVISPQLAYLMTSVLDDEQSRAFEFENDHVLSMWDWTLPTGTVPQVAAKTGTTDDFQDNWTIGYTPNVVVGVWSGNANGEIFKGHVVGITGAAPIWHDVMEHVMGRHDAGLNPPYFNYHFNDYTFPQPAGVVQQATSSANGLAGNGNYDWMLSGDIPQQSGMSNNGDNNGNGNGNNNGNGNGNGNGG